MSEISFEVIDPDKISDKKKEKLEESLGLVSGKASEKEMRIIAKDKKGNPIGYMEIVPEKSKKIMRIDNAYINKEKRGKGVGTEMSKKAEEIAEKMGIKKVYGISRDSKKVRDFWKKKRGFELEKSGRMEKKIKKRKRR